MKKIHETDSETPLLDKLDKLTAEHNKKLTNNTKSDDEQENSNINYCCRFFKGCAKVAVKFITAPLRARTITL